ncbi:nicotinate-nucleotide adenylyltransferase [Tuberibacillus sp. Marseille-P3662]|uniref:nicotinate-nucleotide adenylyltransferase n=1 Tax=Tuberibacillus sp. Marseille-P3662 TaxID=1965358 RepID=UPI000A1CDF55|nr:nicotinate-nucleotide adenylyltransferase [Tuberibacillus sp. Marseille-P3662]
MKNIGLLGGSFDPPHYGHLIMAQEALEKFQLDKVWFLPSYIPPHKRKKTTSASVSHRLNMLKLAIADTPAFDVSTIEIEREGKSYTYDTIKTLKHRFSDVCFYFMIGGDMINDLPNWHNIDELSQMIDFVGFKRAGYQLKKPDNVSIHEVDMPEIQISSTMVRERIKNHQHYRYFIPENVRQYIEEKDVYE